MRLVVITGAGASRDLGAGSKLPLMADWASVLADALDERESGLAVAAGLNKEMSGQEFETALGALLRWQDVRPLSERFRGLTGPKPGSHPDTLRGAYNRETVRLEGILEVINQTLFNLFGAERIDAEVATEAFGNLFGSLGPFDGLVLVTTNYDPAIEIALAGLSRSRNGVLAATRPRAGAGSRGVGREGPRRRRSHSCTASARGGGVVRA